MEGMQNDMWFSRVLEPNKDELMDKKGNLMHKYVIEDDAHLATLMIVVHIVGRKERGRGEGEGQPMPNLRGGENCGKKL